MAGKNNQNQNTTAQKTGFTLIELLVVISIIAILVAFVSANFLGARQRGKDVKKKAELVAMKSALRLYYNEYNSYPASPAVGVTNTFGGCGVDTSPPPVADCRSTCSGTFGTGANCGNVYMKLLPPTTEYIWNYEQRDGLNGVPADDFCLWTTLENSSDKDIANSHLKCDAICSAAVPATAYVQCAD